MAQEFSSEKEAGDIVHWLYGMNIGVDDVAIRMVIQGALQKAYNLGKIAGSPEHIEGHGYVRDS